MFETNLRKIRIQISLWTKPMTDCKWRNWAGAVKVALRYLCIRVLDLRVHSPFDVAL